ncbi:radical SAM protein [Candidatus Woesearchaeota archaeon]|nr:radical SAM protein [Candidatus Woesearchaeota archaeon]
MVFSFTKVLNFLSNQTIKPSNIIIFEVTHKCNFKCIHCDIWKLQKKKELSIREWKKISKQLYEWLGLYTVNLTGGEVFLINGIENLIFFNSKLGIKTNINSNGVLINDSLAEKIIQYKTHAITISLYDLKNENNDFLRGVSNVQDKTIKVIDKLLNYKKQHNSNIFINIAVLLTKLNMPNIENICHWAKQRKLGVSLQSLEDNFERTDQILNVKKSNLWPEKHLVNETFEKINNLKKSYNIINPQNQLNKMRDYYLDNKKAILKYPCNVGYENLIIDPEGNVKFCFARNIKIGNILQNKIKNIWNSPEAKKERKNVNHCQKECRINNCYYTK